MQVFTDISALASYKHAVVTIGSFDGVHRAHQQILSVLTSVAKKIGGVSVVISFQPHPRTVIDPDFPFNFINTIEERNALLEKAGVDVVLIISFTKKFSSLSYSDFIRFLVNNINLHTIVLGYNHNFGKNRAGNAILLKQLSQEYKFQVLEVEKQVIDTLSISSTLIRKLIEQGNISNVNTLLGYSYEVEICISKEITKGIEYQVVLCQPLKIFPLNGTYRIKIKQYYAKICINNDIISLAFNKEVNEIIIDWKYQIYFL